MTHRSVSTASAAADRHNRNFEGETPKRRAATRDHRIKLQARLGAAATAQQNAKRIIRFGETKRPAGKE
jgi:hypothetical protein